MKHMKLLIQEYLAIKFLLLAGKVAPKEMSTEINFSAHQIIKNQIERIQKDI